ncbi:MAG: hypothetical protein ACI4AM_06420 [Muribaculaceae bacterium]
MDWLTNILAIVGALGGIELVKWISTRKAASRKAESEADSSEFAVLHEVNEFLQTQLQDKEQRFAEQTTRLREITAELLTAERERLNAEREIGNLKAELERVRCSDLSCPYRRPPNAYTPPPVDITRQQYMESRKDVQV